MRIVFFIGVVFILSSCNLKSNSFNQIQEGKGSINLSKKAVIDNGSIDDYEKLRIYFLDTKHPEEYLIYSLIMANRYNYSQSYYDVFFCLIEPNINDMNNIDSATANLAMKYLLNASERNHAPSKEIVEKYQIVNEVKNAKQQLLKIYPFPR